MKPSIHPVYHQATIKCACGNTFTAGSTTEKIEVEVCSKCHPAYTGVLKFVDTKGKIDRFEEKRAKAKVHSQTAKKKARKSNA